MQSDTEFSPPVVNASAPPLLPDVKEVNVHEVNECFATVDDKIGLASLLLNG